MVEERKEELGQMRKEKGFSLFHFKDLREIQMEI